MCLQKNLLLCHTPCQVICLLLCYNLSKRTVFKQFFEIFPCEVVGMIISLLLTCIFIHIAILQVCSQVSDVIYIVSATRSDKFSIDAIHKFKGQARFRYSFTGHAILLGMLRQVTITL